MNMIMSKDNFKETELGSIPIDWDIKELNELRNKNDKYSLTGGPFGSELKTIHYTNTGVRVIQLQNIGDGIFLNDYFVYTSEEKANQLLSCNIYPNEIIIAKMADPVARACKIPDLEKRYVMCSDGIRLSVNNNIYNKDFILYAINSKYFRENAIKASTGTTRLRIGLETLRNLKVIIPSLKEQHKIATILSIVDDLIENTDHLINSYTLLKKSLMQILLIKGIGHTEFKETDLGEIPVNWEIVKLGLIVELKHGYQFRENDLTKSGIPIIKIGQISNNRKLDFTNITFIDENRLSEFRDNLINNDDVLMSLTGNIGRVVIVKNLKGYAVQNYRVGRFIPDETKLNKQFLVFILESNYIYQQFNMLSNKTAQANFGKQDINKIKVLLPPIEEQQKISFLLSLIDKTLENYEYENEKLIELKQGLMQQLLTGKIRVRT